jgi:hypothetical protein
MKTRRGTAAQSGEEKREEGCRKSAGKCGNKICDIYMLFCCFFLACENKMKNGWQMKKRKWVATLEASQQQRMVDFSIENPASSKLKALPVIDNLLKNPIVKLKKTSYCHYGAPFRKNTAIISTLPFNPPDTCPNLPCEAFKYASKHTEEVQGQNLKAKYNIPCKLVQDLVGTFMDKYPRAKRFLIIDCFCGFGSIKSAVAAMEPKRPVSVFCNDTVVRRGVDITLDMSGDLNMHFLFPFAVLSVYGDNLQERELITQSKSSFEYLKATETAVLVHASIPCQTYSVAGGNTHRASGSTEPLSPTARRHDVITEHLCDWIHANILFS